MRPVALLASALFVFAACGNDASGTDQPAGGADESTTTADEHAADHAANGDHADHANDVDANMDHSDPDHDMEHGDDASAPPAFANPLPVLPDGSLDPNGVDLSGIEGVTAVQQAYAEDLLVRSITTLPKWADHDKAIADGFLSIGDGPFTGEEHLIHWDWIDDDNWLDPNQPESLVYRWEEQPDGTVKKTLEAAMFLLPEKFNLDNAPSDAGALMQYHIHDDLCFTDFPEPKVAGLRAHGGECQPPLVAFNPNVMVHVWIRPNECGPFAALQGVGGGQIKEGETVNCLPDHESPSL